MIPKLKRIKDTYANSQKKIKDCWVVKENPSSLLTLRGKYLFSDKRVSLCLNELMTRRIIICSISVGMWPRDVFVKRSARQERLHEVSALSFSVSTHFLCSSSSSGLISPSSRLMSLPGGLAGVLSATEVRRKAPLAARARKVPDSSRSAGEQDSWVLHSILSA